MMMIRCSSGMRREKEAAEVLEEAVAACTDVVNEAQELSESCRDEQLAKVTIWTRFASQKCTLRDIFHLKP